MFGWNVNFVLPLHPQSRGTPLESVEVKSSLKDFPYRQVVQEAVR